MKNDPYKKIAPEYDIVMGERDEIALLKKLIPRFHPKAKTILEFACGTGKLIKPFSKKYRVSGLDISRPMLKEAKKAIPGGAFYHGDMTNADIGERFDVVLCLFNSLNHLSNFEAWKRTFKNAKRHLNPGGVFIFDINTPKALEAYFNEPPYIDRTERDVILTEYSRSSKNDLLMKINIFRKQMANIYTFKETVIVEKAYPTADVKAALKTHFKKIIVLDPDKPKPAASSEVLYFACYL